jgi:hypothetical protein
MDIKTRANFENSEFGRATATQHALVFGNGPTIEGEDLKRGLILKACRREFLSGFCTHMIRMSDKKSTNRPKNIVFSNYATRELVKAGGDHASLRRITSSVYSSNELIKSAYPKWRHTTEVIKSHYHQKALREQANKLGHRPYAFTMLLSPTLGKQIVNKGGSGYLHERLTLKLKRALGRIPVIWLVLEAVKAKDSRNITKRGKGSVDRSNGLLHAHGAISLDPSEIQTMDRVVREMNDSEDSKFKNQELRTQVIKDDAYWVEYCNKHRFLNQMFLNGLQRYSRSKVLVGNAEKIYQSDRQ